MSMNLCCYSRLLYSLRAAASRFRGGRGSGGGGVRGGAWQRRVSVSCRALSSRGGEEEDGAEDSRKKPSGGDSGSHRGNDLLKVPGIGLRNRKLLTDKGLCSIEHLREKYSHRDIGKKKEKMIRFLKEDIGIFHNRYVTSIADYVDDLERKGEGEDLVRPASASNKITFCVEGNISVGKTTFLEKIASQSIELANLIEVRGSWEAKREAEGSCYHSCRFAVADSPRADPSMAGRRQGPFQHSRRLLYQPRKIRLHVSELRLCDKDDAGREANAVYI